MSERAYFLMGRSYPQTENNGGKGERGGSRRRKEKRARSLFLSASLVISGREMYFNSVEDTVSAISYGSRPLLLLFPVLVSLFFRFFLASLSLWETWILRAKGCACRLRARAAGRRGKGREGCLVYTREARRRLVRRGTLSLKYPEVFFPRNCRSSSFLGSLSEWPWIYPWERG